MSDMRTLWHKIDAGGEFEGKDWHEVKLHALDANHALKADPDHWKAEKPAAEEPMELEPKGEGYEEFREFKDPT